MKKDTKTTEAPLISGQDYAAQMRLLRSKVEEERARLIARVEELDQLLNQGGKEQKATRASRPRNELSLKEAVLKVMGTKPMTKEEILAGVQASGYLFAGDKPMNTLNTLLYNKKIGFKRADGKFQAPAQASK